MLEKETSPGPIPAPPSRIPSPWGEEPTLGLSKVSPRQRIPGSFPPPYPSRLPLAPGCAPVPPSMGLSPSAPPRPRHPPLGPRPALGPPYGAVQLAVLSRPAAAPALAPLLLEANLPRVLRETAWPASFSHTAPSTCQAGQSLRPQGHLCGWGSGDTRCLWDLTCA